MAIGEETTHNARGVHREPKQGSFNSKNTTNMDNQTKNVEALRQLHKIVTDGYGYLEIERKLSEVVYLLHYLPYESAKDGQVTRLASMLESLKEGFQEAGRASGES